MNDGNLWALLIGSVLLAFFVSLLCSLLEAALLSLSPSQLADIHRRDTDLWQVCRRLKSDIAKPIAVILISNTAAHTIGAAVAGYAFGRLFNEGWLWVFTLALTVLMVQYTEILPKTLGVRFSVRIISASARSLAFLGSVFSPMIWVIRIVNRPFEPKHKKSELRNTADEITALAELARSSQEISSRQERIIRAVPMLSELPASRIMLPKEQISFLTSDQSVVEAMNFAARDFHTRYPVRDKEDIDKVRGYINFKELVATFRANPAKAQLADILRPVSYAEPDETAAELLERFSSKHCHMAMVRDEDGHIQGMLTLEDLVEELLGDLDDEFDSLPRTFYSPGEGFWVVGGGISLAQLGRDTHLALPRRAEPVANWFARQIKHQVRAGEIFRYNGVEFGVRKIRRGRVLEFNVKNLAHAE